MSQDLAVLVGVFVGGATPWLEAIIVIPGGIIAGANPVLVIIAGVTGNLLTVAVSAWFGERIASWWRERRARGRQSPEPGPAGAASGRRGRVERIMRRGGLPALALVGPLGIGTQVSALVAVGMGVGARAAFLWIGGGTIGWSAVAAVLTLTGLSFAGIG